MLGAFLLVVIGLRQGGVQLMRAGRAHALVFVINVRRRIQRLLQATRPEERRGPPLRVQLPHFAGNLDLTLGADLLHNQAHRKQRSQVVRAQRFQRTGMQRRRHRLGQVGGNVIPGKGNAVGREVVLDGFHAEILSARAGDWHGPRPEFFALRTARARRRAGPSRDRNSA